MTKERRDYNRLLTYLRKALAGYYAFREGTDETGENPVYMVIYLTPAGKARRIIVYPAEQRAYLAKDGTEEVLDYLGQEDEKLAELLRELRRGVWG